VPNFVSVPPPTAELAGGEKSDTPLLNHSTSLFDMPGTEAYRFGIISDGIRQKPKQF